MGRMTTEFESLVEQERALVAALAEADRAHAEATAPVRVNLDRLRGRIATAALAAADGTLDHAALSALYRAAFIECQRRSGPAHRRIVEFYATHSAHIVTGGWTVHDNREITCHPKVYTDLLAHRIEATAEGLTALAARIPWRDRAGNPIRTATFEVLDADCSAHGTPTIEHDLDTGQWRLRVRTFSTDRIYATGDTAAEIIDAVLRRERDLATTD